MNADLFQIVLTEEWRCKWTAPSLLKGPPISVWDMPIHQSYRIGAGKMGKLVVKHLSSKGCEGAVVVNRSIERVDAICEELEDFEIIYKPPDEMISSAAGSDVIFTSTAPDNSIVLKRTCGSSSSSCESSEVKFLTKNYLSCTCIKKLPFLFLYHTPNSCFKMGMSSSKI